jgi:predicted SAM-dependent methyltransferase
VTAVGTDILRVNCGSGGYNLPGWLNIDEREPADVVLRVPPLPFESDSITELYAGHFLEHLEQTEARQFLDECYRVLRSGGRLGIMVPDTREVFRRYILGEPAPMEFPAGVQRDLRDLDEACAALLFSTVQPSHHLWAYDAFTLSRALLGAGFEVLGEFDRWRDPRVAVGAWYQVGVDAMKP